MPKWANHIHRACVAQTSVVVDSIVTDSGHLVDLSMTVRRREQPHEKGSQGTHEVHVNVREWFIRHISIFCTGVIVELNLVELAEHPPVGPEVMSLSMLCHTNCSPLRHLVALTPRIANYRRPQGQISTNETWHYNIHL